MTMITLAMLPGPGQDGIAVNSGPYNDLLLAYEATIAPQPIGEFSEEIRLILRYVGEKGFAVLSP